MPMPSSLITKINRHSAFLAISYFCIIYENIKIDAVKTIKKIDLGQGKSSPKRIFHQQIFFQIFFI
jgi:hypothetical protein